MKFVSQFLLALIAITAFGFTTVQAQDVPTALDFKMKNIDGEEVSLAKYAGKVVVFVNVASKCGYTKQYKQLQELHEQYADQGVAVIGIPCNQFGGQEPGTEQEIAEFCESKFGVEFDLMSKVDVNGDQQCPLYKYLTGLDLAPAGKGPVKWNFEKIVLDKAGKPIARFGSKVRPDSDTFMDVIKQALAPAETTTGAVKPYSHKSEKSGTAYYLFSKQVPLKNSSSTSTIYFFAKDAKSEKGTPVSEVPAGKVVSETKTGMLVLKNAEGDSSSDSDK